MKTIIHINRQTLHKNKKYGTNEPAIIVRNYKGNRYGHHVVIHGPCKIVYPEKPLRCGARVWIETTSAVTVKRGKKK